VTENPRDGLIVPLTWAAMRHAPLASYVIMLALLPKVPAMQRTFARNAGAVGVNINVDINVETACLVRADHEPVHAIVMSRDESCSDRMDPGPQTPPF
jgi:hypothetical protein